jgi:lysozyme family protein
MTFDESFTKLLGHEGSYSFHPADPGAETMWGVTAAVAREAGYTGAMQDLPLEFARTVANNSYWVPLSSDQLPAEIRYALFDAAYHSGAGQAARWLQRALGVADDGRIGPLTIAAARQADPQALTKKMLAQRLRFMTGLSHWPSFSRGWARRIADLMDS